MGGLGRLEVGRGPEHSNDGDRVPADWAGRLGVLQFLLFIDPCSETQGVEVVLAVLKSPNSAQILLHSVELLLLREDSDGAEWTELLGAVASDVMKFFHMTLDLIFDPALLPRETLSLLKDCFSIGKFLFLVLWLDNTIFSPVSNSAVLARVER